VQPSRWIDALVARYGSVDRRLFVVWTSLCVSYVAAKFVTAMLSQTGGEWSAPLDDVFIHFDYARATARGYPFQWSEGNGYSSGNTSLTYPFVLAFGYWVGLRGQFLMAWAVLVACLSVLVFFHGAASLIAPAGPWAKYLLPPVVLSLGALDWSLFSGMENAFHLGIWGACAAAYDRFVKRRGRPWLLGGALAVLTLTRPESIVCVAAFGIAAGLLERRRGLWAAASACLVAGLPSAIAIGAQSAVNRLFTGEWAQAGAVSKLALYHPYMTSQEKLDDWIFHLKYVLARTTEHHFSQARFVLFGEEISYGLIVPAVALVPLAVKALRGAAILLWVQVAGWALIVATNGQVRWQNERYVMSGVAWLFVLAAMGLAALARGFGDTTRARALWGARLAAAGVAASLYWHHQLPNFRDQVWFYARASRNIRDQQIMTGRLLKELKPRRILVGDAGAVIYAADRPGLDIIGLGGYHDYPFARATRSGIGASIELIERMPDRERPDVMAIYPSWWGDMPIVFGQYLQEVPVFGNVICGGAAKVIYKADWSSLDRAGWPKTLREGEHVVGSIDVADLIDEKRARYEHPRPAAGFVTWRVLPSPDTGRRELFDAGRIIPGGRAEAFDIDLPQQGGRLVLRTVGTGEVTVGVTIDGRTVGEIRTRPTETWDEPSVELPLGLPARGRVVLTPRGGDVFDCHVWSVR
jgi:hypothetical protein